MAVSSETAACDDEGVSSDAVPTIEGERVRLRPLRDGDVEERVRLGRQPEISQAFGGELIEPTTLTIEEARLQLADLGTGGYRWIIAAVDDDRFLGATWLDRIDKANRSANFAIGIFDPDSLDRGLGTEATKMVVRFGFERLGLHRIGLTVLADNSRAVAAYRKSGFEVEGRLRETLWNRGEWHDDLIMAVLATNWQHF